jgi:type I restriction enzyme S subunit
MTLKKISFGDISTLKSKIPVDWEVDSVGNIVKSINYGYPVSISKNEDTSGIPIISAADITKDDRLLYNQTRRIIPTNELREKLILRDGDVLFNWRNAPNLVGKAAVYEKQEITHIYASFLLNIKCIHQRVHNHFLKYYFRYFREKGIFAKLATPAAGQANCNKSEVKGLAVILPPVPEQKRIAAVLSAVQEAKEKTEAVIDAARILEKSLRNFLFTYGPVPLSSIPSVKLKKNFFGKHPQHWQIKKLKDISIRITKGSSPGYQGFDYQDKGIMFIRSQNICRGKLNLEDVKYVPEDFNLKEKKSILKENDLLINIVGTSIGRVAIADRLIEGANLNQAVAIVRLKEGYNHHFVMNYFFTQFGELQLQRQKKSTTRANLSLADIGNIIIPFPDPKCQEEISEILEAIQRKIETEEYKKRALDHLFISLLENLLSGKILLHHPVD